MNSQDISSSYNIPSCDLPLDKALDSVQGTVSMNIDDLYNNINQLIHSVQNKDDIIEIQVVQQNNIADITFDHDPSQLKLKIRTLEIQVGVQKDTIVRLQGEKIRLQSDMEDLKAELGINHNNMSFNKSIEQSNTQHILLMEIQKLKNQVQRLSNPLLNPEQIMPKSNQYQATIRNLSIQIQRLMSINDQKKNVQYTNQVLRGQINKLAEINRVIGQQISMYRQAVNNLSHQRNQLLQYVQIAKQMQNRVLSLQNELSKYKQIELRTPKRNQNSQSIERQLVKSRVDKNTCRRNHSPLDDLPNGSRYIPKTPKKQNVSLSKVMTPTNKTSKLTIQNSKVSTQQSKWMQLQDRINALKYENQALKNSMYTK